MTRKSALCALLCALFCALLITSMAYIAFEAGHNCPDDGCAICVKIHSRFALIKRLAFTAAVGLPLAGGFFRPLCSPRRPKEFFVPATPVSLKVKMTR